MDHSNGKSGNRRDFLFASGRYLALGSLGSLLVGQEIKRRQLEENPNCIKLYTCRDCVEFQACNKSQAEQFRKSRAQPGIRFES